MSIDNLTHRVGTRTARAPDSDTVGLHSICTDEFEAIVDEFPSLSVPAFKPEDEIKHNVEHHIVTEEGSPLYARARRLNSDKLDIAKAAFREMEEMGICRRSDSFLIEGAPI